jgi:hypothetical protein
MGESGTRPPTKLELQQLENTMRVKSNVKAEMVKAFLVSTEYRRRFDQDFTVSPPR